MEILLPFVSWLDLLGRQCSHTDRAASWPFRVSGCVRKLPDTTEHGWSRTTGMRLDLRSAGYRRASAITGGERASTSYKTAALPIAPRQHDGYFPSLEVL
jgi:hypothetical protein